MITKRDFFINALKAEAFRRRAWVFSIFAMIREDSESTEIYPYKIEKVKDKYAFRDPNYEMDLTVIEDSDTSIPLLNHKEQISLGYFDAINLPQGIKEMTHTRYGNLFFNYVALIYPFGNKIPFQLGRVSINSIEDIIASKLESTPKENEPRDPEKIYVDEYLKFGEAVFYLSGFTQLWVPGGSAKTITCHPDTAKFKAGLIEKYKDQMHDPVILSKIEGELVKFDKENWLKGDEGAEGFLIKKKSTDIVRKKMFLMYGAGEGLEESNDVDPIVNSLEEGWDITKFPELNNTLRSGSYNRGAETQLGGESVKWLLRASSNMGITEDDCGTKLGIPLKINETNARQLINRYLVENDDVVLVTAETANSYIGKEVIIRSPMFCKLDKTDYCAKCCGNKLATHKTGLSMAVSDYGSAFLSIFMAKMHSTGLATAKLNIETSLF